MKQDTPLMDNIISFICVELKFCQVCLDINNFIFSYLGYEGH